MRLTRDEILLIAAVLGALLLGVIVKHYRDAARLAAPAAAVPAKKP